MKYLQYFFDGFFNSYSSEAKPLLSPENHSLQAPGFEIKIDNPLEEAEQPLLAQTNTPLPEIKSKTGKSSTNPIENEIRERQELFDSITSDLIGVEKSDKRYFIKKGLFLIAVFIGTGGMGVCIYLANKFRLDGSNSYQQLLDDWYQNPINTTSSNITCTELFPSPPAGCNHTSPLGVDTNSSCFSILDDICHNCVSDHNLGPFYAEFGGEVPDECNPESIIIPLVFTIMAAGAFEIGAITFYIKLRQHYTRENIQAWKKIGFSVPRAVTANQFITRAPKTFELLEITNSCLTNTLHLDVVKIVLEYLGDPGFNKVHQAKSSSTPNLQSFFFTIYNEERQESLNETSRTPDHPNP